MKLPSFPFFKKASPKEYFLALLLQDELLRAVVFEEESGIIHRIGEGKSMLPAPLDDTSFEELLQASDKAISAAEIALPNNIQGHKTIFGVKEDWTEDLQISKDHLSTLKKLCDELDLSPIGFLVFAEAIAHLLQKEEGAPVSAVLVELGLKHITATLLRAGRVVASKQTSTPDVKEQNTSGVLAKAVDSLLTQFADVEILPSRIILLDTQKRAHLAQQFNNHTWSKQLPFLHVPQVTPLPDDFETQAILFGTATQMGFDVGLPEVKEGSMIKDKGSVEENEKEEEKEVKSEEESEGVTEAGAPHRTPAATAKPSDGGGDRQDPEDSEEMSESSGENFGFVKDADVLEKAPKKPIAFDNLKTPEDETTEEFASETFANIPEEVKEDEEKTGATITEGIQKILANVKRMFHRTSNPSGSSRKMLFFLPVILLLVTLSIFWYIFGVKATATLYINPKNVTASQGITFSSTNGTDVSSDTIGGNATPITESGSTSTSATGSQDVGDKAKGTVTIYNNDSTSHSIDAGTTITSSNGLVFITNTTVTVASASGDIFSGTQPGTQNVDVTASSIGTDSNLPSGTKFSIGDSTVIAAKNTNAFSGGTKKTVTVVSQKDLDKLTSDLTNNLGGKAKQDAQNNSSGKTILSTFLSTDMSNQKFDHKVGDQTGSVSLSATITYSALSYDKADLDKIALAILQSSNASEDISSQNISEDIQNPTVSKDTKTINATLAIKAGLLPKIDTTKVAGELAGKPFTQALNILSDVPQLDSVVGRLSPNLFFLPKSFPRIASHITVGVKANE